MKKFKKCILALLIVILALGAVPMTAKASSKKSDWQITKEFCRKYRKKVKLIKSNELTDKQYAKAVLHRERKTTILVDKVISVSDGSRYGWYKTKDGHQYIIGYNKKVPKGKKVVSYVIYDPSSNECDAILAVVDNGKIR